MSLSILHSHQGSVHSLRVLQDRLPIAWGTIALLPSCWSRVTFLSLDVQQRLGRLRVAEGYFPQTPLDDQLLVLGLELGCLHRPLNLLLHPLHMIVAVDLLSAATHTTAGLKQVGLCKMSQWLGWMLSWSSPYLTVNLVVEILYESSFAVGIGRASRRRDKLLKLDASDEILVLRSHHAIPLGQEENLVVPFRSLRVFFQVSTSLFLRELHRLLTTARDGSRT